MILFRTVYHPPSSCQDINQRLFQYIQENVELFLRDHSGGSKTQVTGQVRLQVRSQVTSGHRSGHRSQVTGQKEEYFFAKGIDYIFGVFGFINGVDNVNWSPYRDFGGRTS